MAHIVVDDAQAKLISEATGRIEVRDRHGKHLGYVFSDFTEADIRTAKERRESSEARHSTEDVLKHLHSLAQQ